MSGNTIEDLYVSSVHGHAVVRFSAMMAGRQALVLIGAERNIREPKRITWNTEEVVRIPASEHRKFFREYSRAIARGDLIRRTEEDFAAWQSIADEAAAAAADAKRAARIVETAPEAPATTAPEPPALSTDSEPQADAD